MVSIKMFLIFWIGLFALSSQLLAKSSCEIETQEYCGAKQVNYSMPSIEYGKVLINPNVKPTPLQRQKFLAEITEADQKETQILFEEIKNRLIAKIKDGRPLTLLSPEEKAYIKRIQNIKFEVAKNSDEMCAATLSPRAHYTDDDDQNKVSICPSFFKAPKMTQITVLSHELAHGIDSCDIGSNPTPGDVGIKNFDIGKVPFVGCYHSLRERYHPQQHQWVSNNSKVIQSNPALKELVESDCSSITAEAFADTISASITNEYVSENEISSQQFREGMRFWQDLACQDKGYMIYPKPMDRLGTFLSYPRLEKLMDCENPSRVPTLDTLQETNGVKNRKGVR